MGLKNKLTSISMARLTAGATLLGGEKILHCVKNDKMALRLSPQSKETKKNLERFAKDCSGNPKDALELLNRMYTLSRFSGYPEILEQTDDNINLMSKVIEKGCQHKTPHYLASSWWLFRSDPRNGACFS